MNVSRNLGGTLRHLLGPDHAGAPGPGASGAICGDASIRSIPTTARPLRGIAHGLMAQRPVRRPMPAAPARRGALPDAGPAGGDAVLYRCLPCADVDGVRLPAAGAAAARKPTSPGGARRKRRRHEARACCFSLPAARRLHGRARITRSPTSPTPDSFAAADQAPLSACRWRTKPDLTQLVDAVSRCRTGKPDHPRAGTANLDLQTAASRVREARQQEIIAGAAGLPQVNCHRAMPRICIPAPILSPAGRRPVSSSASVVRRLRRHRCHALFRWASTPPGRSTSSAACAAAVEAAEAGSEAARWQMRDGEVTLTAEIATDYVALRAAQARLAILDGRTQKPAGHAGPGCGARQDRLCHRTGRQPAICRCRPPPQAQIPALEAAGSHHATTPSRCCWRRSPTRWRRNWTRPRRCRPFPPACRWACRRTCCAAAPISARPSASWPRPRPMIGVAIADALSQIQPARARSPSPAIRWARCSTPAAWAKSALGMITWPMFHGGETHANIHAKEEERAAGLSTPIRRRCWWRCRTPRTRWCAMPPSSAALSR